MTVKLTPPRTENERKAALKMEGYWLRYFNNNDLRTPSQDAIDMAYYAVKEDGLPCSKGLYQYAFNEAVMNFSAFKAKVINWPVPSSIRNKEFNKKN